MPWWLRSIPGSTSLGYAGQLCDRTRVLGERAASVHAVQCKNAASGSKEIGCVSGIDGLLHGGLNPLSLEFVELEQ